MIEGIEFRGARRVPQDTLRALIFSRVGDVYNEDTIRRDFSALWNTNRFDDIRVETEKGERGGLIVRFVVTERRVIRDIKYEGAKSVSTSDILDRFKERKRSSLTVESMYDPNVVNRAAVVLKELLGEHGHQFATVTPELKAIPPSSLEVTFNVVEGPKIKVGEITILGNQAFSQREVIAAMKNLKGIGIPHSIYFERIFATTFDSAKLEEDKERIRDAYQKEGYFTAKALDQTLKLRDVGGATGGFHFPLLKENRPGKVEDITIPVEEGKRYYLAKIRFHRWRETIPLHGVSRTPVPDAAVQLILVGEAAQWSQKPDQDLQPVRLHRLRSRAADRHCSQQQQDQSDPERRRGQTVLRAAHRW